MYAVVLLVVVAILSLLITRVATIALAVTGMSQQAARFQARSALSGVGYTTREAETVVNHPVRRRIVMAPCSPATSAWSPRSPGCSAGSSAQGAGRPPCAAAQMMVDHDCGCVPIIDDERRVEGSQALL